MTAGLGNLLGKGITIVTKQDALTPIIGLEGFVVTGRTAKAYKRGGVEEARERAIEETSGSLVWLGGVKLFNYIGDKVIAKFLNVAKGSNGKRLDSSFDVGQDAVRKPFNNFIKNKLFNPKNLSERKLSMLKFGKVAASVIAANYIIGFVVPPLNHKITNSFKKQDKNHIVPHYRLTVVQDDVPNKSKFDNFKTKITQNPTISQGQPAFKGGLNTFTNFMENTNTGQLLSTDLGVLGGRTYNARKKEEKVEIVVRDGGSIYFYMFAQDHVRAAMNKAESGRWTRLDPNTAGILHNHFASMFDNEHNATMSIEEFKKRAYGNQTSTVDIDKFFGEKAEAITLDRFNEIETNPEIQARAAKMSTVQPRQQGKGVLTRAQVRGVYQGGELNNPELLKSAHELYTDGASSNPNKFVSYKKLEKLNGRMKDYVDDVCKAAKKNGNIVDLNLLKKMKNKNMMYNGINFVAGFAVAALFLSKLIPDLQYWITKKMTGVDAFPGTHDYQQQVAQATKQVQAKPQQQNKIKTIA